MNERHIVQELLTSGLDDWVSAHDVVWLCAEDLIDEDSKSRLRHVLERIYLDGLMVPGDLGDTGFEDWESAPDAWIGRSIAQLDDVDWRPMGGGFWLRLTPRGERLARDPGSTDY